MDRRQGHLPRQLCAANWAVFQYKYNAHSRERGRRHACAIAGISAYPVLGKVCSIANIDDGLRLRTFYWAPAS